MRRILSAFILCLFLFSCSFVRTVETRRPFSDLGVDWNYAGKMNPVYKPIIDSTFEEIIRKFNSEAHSYKIHKRNPQDENYITFTFVNGKFVSNGGVTAGYIVSGLGLIATSAITLAASGATWLAAFYYFPADKLQIATMLSPSLAKRSKPSMSLLEKGALFSTRSKRINKITVMLEKAIYEILGYLDRRMASKK